MNNVRRRIYDLITRLSVLVGWTRSPTSSQRAPEHVSWRAEMLALLNAEDPAKLDILRARLLRDSNLPQSLFKLCPATEYSVKNLEEGTVWLAGADAFNDPYDSAWSLTVANLPARSGRELIIALRESGVIGHLSQADIAAIEASDNPMRTMFDVVIRREPSVPAEKHF